MEGTLQNVLLTEIGDTVGTPPNPRLRESIGQVGIIQPVLLAELVGAAGEISYRIVDGNRRIATARSLGLTYVPAIVLHNMSDLEIAQCTLIANGLRNANYLTEFWAIRHLEREGSSRADIAAFAGMATSTTRMRDGLSDLNRSLFVALRNGHIPQSIAMSIARLPKDVQDSLAKHFEQHGNIRKRDIEALVGRNPAQTAVGAETAAVELNQQISQAIATAQSMGVMRGEFLQLVDRLWDTE